MTDTTATLEPTSDHARLLELTGDDPYLRWSIATPLTRPALIGPGAVAAVRQKHERVVLGFVPLPAASDDAFLATLRAARPWAEDLGVTTVSVPQRYATALAQTYPVTTGGDWDWMWTTTVPPLHPAEQQIIELDDTADAAEIEIFARQHNPRVWTEIGTGAVHQWLAIRAPSGDLLAVGGAESEDSGVPHLAGIVTHTGYRGHGWGTAISAALTRSALADHAVCTLGMFSDNDAARAVYRRLGYRTAHAWCSRRLAV